MRFRTPREKAADRTAARHRELLRAKMGADDELDLFEESLRKFLLRVWLIASAALFIGWIYNQ